MQTVFCHVGKGDGAAKMTNNDASKHLGGRKGKQQTMKTNTKQGAAYTTWARSVPCFLQFQDRKREEKTTLFGVNFDQKPFNDKPMLERADATSQT